MVLLHSSLLLFLLYLGGLDATDLGLDILVARRCQSISLESSLGAGLTTSFCDIRVFIEPLHVEDALQVGSSMAIFLQKRRADILSSLTDTFPRVERKIGGVLDGLPSDLFVVFVVEGQYAGKQEIGDYT